MGSTTRSTARRKDGPATGAAKGTLPITHEWAYGWRILISALSGAAAGICGTIVHRGGAAWNVPWGLALALLIVGLSAWASRSRADTMGLGAHLITVGLTSYLLAGSGPGGDIFVPVGGESLVTFFSQHAGYIWLLGAAAVQLAILVMPARWFRVRPVPIDGDTDGAGHDTGHGDGAALGTGSASVGRVAGDNGGRR